ncbi:MAG: 23S rRNA (adenine(2503)-C(2))-methyltransferase RlmN [Clostridiales bacterium]|nr:23S rRNA (adenine(2503)-C(2))-methyltransferase RlmN [Clostridiales bacterium]
MRKALLDCDLNELEEVVASMGQPAFRAGQLYKWLLSGADFSEMTNLPLSFRNKLSQNYVARALKIEQTYPSKDGSMKLLYRYTDGNLIEGVYMPHGYGDTLCVSTQVGCRMGCAFCASGIGGLVRNLTAGEIAAQVIAVNKLLGGNHGKKLSNLVLMGSGEPLDNYENVTKFIRLMTAEDGLNFSSRGISLSTSGIVENIRKLADDGFSVTLSLSLHATTDDARQALMPVARKYTLHETIEAMKYYFKKTGRRVIYEYALIKGQNMSTFDVKRLVAITKGYPCHVNLIKLNYVEEKGLEGCSEQEAKRFLQRLTEAGVSATIRRSFGNDVGGACGQLRRRYEQNG